MIWSARGRTSRLDLMRARHRLSKLLLRHGIRLEDGPAVDPATPRLAATRSTWEAAAQATLLDAHGAIDALGHRREHARA